MHSQMVCLGLEGIQSLLVVVLESAPLEGYLFCHRCSPTFEENSDLQIQVSWPSHNITESLARERCRNITVNKAVIGDLCYNNIIGNGTSSDDIIEACVSDVQVLSVFFNSSL